MEDIKSALGSLSSNAERALRGPVDLAQTLPDELIRSVGDTVSRIKENDFLTISIFGEAVTPAQALVRTAVFCACWGFSLATKQLESTDTKSK
ncbi:MAG: hypothetical protein H6799_02710 [Candidatus Nomurabacteria bacterium]|nr:MAG: hypothetical protein H6799_02710 [Candidatus Nomurabacteria bacterium]HRV76095.1 hypothetical protein [Candidatus Saccharimonadales bacterium]